MQDKNVIFPDKIQHQELIKTQRHYVLVKIFCTQNTL